MSGGPWSGFGAIGSAASLVGLVRHGMRAMSSTRSECKTGRPYNLGWQISLAANEKFSLPGSGFQVVVKLVKAYSHLRTPQDLKQFGAVAGVDADTVTRNNGFLIMAGQCKERYRTADLRRASRLQDTRG